MSNQINLSKEELTDYLTEIEKAEHFAEWLYKRRASAHTLESLLSAPASVSTAKAGKVGTGDTRAPLDYAAIFQIVQEAGAAGLNLKAICKAAKLNYADDKGRLRQGLTGEKAKAAGISVTAGNYSYAAPAAPEIAPAGEATAPATKPAKKGNK